MKVNVAVSLKTHYVYYTQVHFQGNQNSTFKNVQVFLIVTLKKKNPQNCILYDEVNHVKNISRLNVEFLGHFFKRLPIQSRIIASKYNLILYSSSCLYFAHISKII